MRKVFGALLLTLWASDALAQAALRPDQIQPGTPNITTGVVGNFFQIGSTIPWRTDSTASPTFTSADITKTVELSFNGAITSTLPAATGSLGDNTGFGIQLRTGSLTLTAASGTINGNSSIKIGPYQLVILASRGGNWYASYSVPQPATQTGTTVLDDAMLWITAGSGTPVISRGTIAGGPTAYTIASPVPTVSSNAADYIVCASIPATVTPNTGAATLAVGSAGALPLRRNTNSGAQAFSGGEFPGSATGGGEIQTCFKVDSGAATWVMMSTPAGGTTLNPSAHLITPNEWANGQFFLCTSACSLTLPNLATTTLSSQSGPTVMTVGVLATLTVQGTDVINNGQPGASNAPPNTTTFVVPADISAALFTSGTAGSTAYSIPVGPIQYSSLTFYTNQVINAPASFLSVATPRTVVGIKCRVDTPSGVTSTINVYTAPSGTALGAGGSTKLNTNACNLNGTANTTQDMGVTSSSIPADYQVGFVVATGSPITDGGTQLIQVNFR